MANGILKYTSRDYDSIKTDLIDSISSLTDLWTSRNDGDPGIVLVKLMSALGDMISYNFDKQALEYYAPTVTQRKNRFRVERRKKRDRRRRRGFGRFVERCENS